MSLPKGASKTAKEFGRAVIKKKWSDIVPLLSADAQTRHTAESLAAALAWEHLGPRLRQEFLQATGESEDMVPTLDPPKRIEVFEVEDRDPPEGHNPAVPFGWIEIDFQPAESSEFDVCYNCFLCIIDENGPRISHFAIENAME